MTAKKKQVKRKTPVTRRGQSVLPNDMKTFMEEWSLSRAEANHVETIEEANDFNLPPDPEDEDFFHGLTVYEMHEVAEENLALYNEQEKESQVVPESNETDVPGELTTDPAHDQSAPDEQHSVPENTG